MAHYGIANLSVSRKIYAYLRSSLDQVFGSGELQVQLRSAFEQIQRLPLWWMSPPAYSAYGSACGPSHGLIYACGIARPLAAQCHLDGASLASALVGAWGAIAAESPALQGEVPALPAPVVREAMPDVICWPLSSVFLENWLEKAAQSDAIGPIDQGRPGAVQRLKRSPPTAEQVFAWQACHAHCCRCLRRAGAAQTPLAAGFLARESVGDRPFEPWAIALVAAQISFVDAQFVGAQCVDVQGDAPLSPLSKVVALVEATETWLRRRALGGDGLSQMAYGPRELHLLRVTKFFLADVMARELGVEPLAWL